MKKKYIGLAVVVLIFGIIFIPRIHDRLTNGSVVDNIRSDEVDKTIKATNSLSTSKEEKKGKTLLSNEEIEIINAAQDDHTIAANETLLTLHKVPDFSFTNQDGETIDNHYYQGKVYVVEFFFSTCPSICPIMNTNMLKIESQFANEPNFGIASISIDPEYDTVKVLKEYTKGYEVSHPHWNFLTGDKTKILKLSNEGFNLYAAKDDNEAGGFAHSGLFALVDQNGFVRSRNDVHGNPLIYYNGLEDQGIQMLIEDIKKLL